MKIFNKFYRHHFEGETGIKTILQISFPIMISQACESLMMFTDRYFLTKIDGVGPSASMVGGFTSFLLSIFLVGLLGFINPLVAQYKGAARGEKVALVIGQGSIIALLAYPLILLVGYFLVPSYFSFIGIHEEERKAALDYFFVINLGTIFLLMKTTFASYFSGIKKTRIVMISNLLGLIVNVPATYFLVFGGLGSYFSGVRGAALATVFSECLTVVVFLYSYRFILKQKIALRIDPEIMKKLFTFGASSGMELFLIFFAFSNFVNLFHSYGTQEALAMTITFNWDILAFLPLLGLNFGLMGIIGEFMGGRSIDKALESTFSGLKIALTITLYSSFAFLFYTEELISFFLPPGESPAEIIAIAGPMLKSVSLYIFASSVNMVLTALLRASGDTKGCLMISVSTFWSVLFLSYFGIKHWEWKSFSVWLLFVGGMFIQSLLYYARFRQGLWRKIEIVKKTFHV